MCANSSPVKYDIELDIKIINAIISDRNDKIPISQLLNYLGVHSARLDEHLEKLVKWNIIVDKKPESPGKARLISLARPYHMCMYDLIKLKDCIAIVNEYFSE